MSQHDDFTPAVPAGPIETEAQRPAPQESDTCVPAASGSDTAGEITAPMLDAVPPDNATTNAEAALVGAPSLPPAGFVIADKASIPTAEDSIRFVIDRVRFKHFGRRMSARGSKYADEAVRLSITREAVVCDLSSATIPSTTSVPYAEGGAPTGIASFEVPARLLRHLATPNKKEPGPNGKRYFDGSVVFIVSITEACICLLDEESILCFSMINRTPVRAAFPEPTGMPMPCEAIALRRALLAVQPAASRDDVRELPYCQVEIKDAQATAARKQLFAQYCHQALAGLQFHIAQKDVAAVVTLLTLTDATVTVRADENAVLIEDERTRFGFRSLPEALPDVQMIAAAQPTHPFECDRDELRRALELTSIISGRGTRDLPISFSFVVRHHHVCLQASAEQPRNSYKCISIPIRMAADWEMTLLREIAPFPVSGEPAGDQEADSSTRTDALLLPPGPAIYEGSESSLEEDLPVLELGHYRHAELYDIVGAMTAPVLSCGFLPERALFITGKTDEVDTRFVFAPKLPDQAHGLTPRRGQ